MKLRAAVVAALLSASLLAVDARVPADAANNAARTATAFLQR